VVFRYFFAFFVAVLIAGTAVAVPRDHGQAGAAEAENAALNWVDGVVEPARIEDDEWEVDVVRPDGSLFEVALDHDLALREIDEEIGPGGLRARDELTGAARRRAILAAFAVTGPGRVSSVERDSADEVEVNVRRDDGTQVEVELDSELHVGEVEPEDPDDE
jgi:hypothetical protein